MAKIISIAQQKGGAGKSTIAAHLAIALSQKGAKVLIVDIDPQSTLKTWFDIREKTFGKGYTGIQLLESSGWRVSSSIGIYKDKMDIIIIDSPPHTELEAKNAIRMSDLVLIPMQASPTDIWATKATVDFAQSEHKIYKIILNRYNPNSKQAKLSLSGIDNILNSYLGSRVAFSSCFMYGKSVTETDPSSQAAKEVRSLTDEILEILQLENSLEQQHNIAENKILSEA